MYFMTEKELAHLQCSYLYQGFSFAMIFYREMKRQDKFRTFSLNKCSNFFLRWNNNAEVEILFPDHSHLLLKFKENKCYVFHPQKSLFAEFNLM